jgi:hypothetical protein
MGVLVTFPDGSKRYMSIGDNTIEITRMSGGDLIPEGQSPPTLYRVATKIGIWTLNEDGTINDSIGESVTQIFIPELNGINLYEKLYEQFKQTLYNYENDSTNRARPLPTSE